MATLTSKYSLAEQAKRIDPDGKLANIVEVLNRETGMVLEEAPWMQSNDIWVNKTTRRGSLPSGTWRKLNSGVATEVSRVTEVLDTIGMLETYAEHDQAYIDSMPDKQVARMQESNAFIEGLGQTLATTFLYGNTDADPDQFHGLQPRLSTVDAEFIINAGGSGNDNTSIYVVTWGPTEVYFIYPKNMDNMGIVHEDLGKVTITDATTSAPNSSQFEGYRDHFVVRCGLAVKHPKCIGRVANIEVTGTDNIFDEDDLITLLNEMKTGENTRIYCNQTIMTQAQIKLKDKLNVNWSVEEGLGGRKFMHFQGIPVRKIDKDILLNTETTIS